MIMKIDKITTMSYGISIQEFDAKALNYFGLDA